VDRQRREPFLDLLVTGDEKWVLLKNPDRQHEWLSPGQKPSAKPKKDFRQKKVMLCVFWSPRGVVHWELLEQGQNVNSELYCQQLERVNQALGRRRGGVVFLDGNARPHRARVTNALIERLGWDRLNHPPYSPDLAPSDFHLFRSLEQFLRGKEFRNIGEVRRALQEFFDSKNAEFYRRGIFKLMDKWREVEGEYYD
jgi:histone-lysine N-methyltransferase SETMAR